MKYIPFIILFCLFASCANNNSTDKKQVSNNVSDSANNKTQTAAIKQTPPDTNIKADNWIDSQMFFPVFQFSKTSIGIVFPIHTDPPFNNFDILFNIADSLDSRKTPEYRRPKDMLDEKYSQATLRYDDWLERKIFSIYHGPFYLYCTKGTVKVNARDVIYNYQACGEVFIALRLQNIDLSKYGNPLFCSRKEYRLKYGHFEKEMSLYGYQNKSLYDADSNQYSNRLPEIVFAKLDSFYFAYNDDFSWGESDSFLFPDRTVYIKRGKKILTDWDIAIDLFGIECD